jgi:VWFA-related protein
MLTQVIRKLVFSLLVLTLVIPPAGISAWAQDKKKQDKNARGNDQQAPPPQSNPGYSISVTVPVVTVDAVVTDGNGNYLPDLKKENFRITEEGAVQTISNFAPSEAPITIVLLVEFSQLGYYVFTNNAINWAAAFLQNLKPNDWVALETFNMRPNIEVDFTHNHDEILHGLSSLFYPPFHESNLFDAVSDVLDRMKDVKGKKAVLVLASGLDTFSRLTLDKAMQRVRETDATIFTVGVGEQLFLWAEANAGMGGGFGQQLNFIQAENQLKTFASMTGGRSWLPRFDGEIPDIMRDVAASLRNQYSMSYTPSNEALDGKYRKIKVELVAPDGGPLTVLDQRGKKVKFQVYARQGYTSPKSSVDPVSK